MSHESARYAFTNKSADCALLAQELEAFLKGEHDLIANTANATSLIYHALLDLNWRGVYLLRDKDSGFSLIELAGVNHVEDGIGGVGELAGLIERCGRGENPAS